MVFHDRRLQYTEHQQLEGWRWNRPGDRILDIGEFPWQHFGWCWRRCGCLKCPQPGSQSLDFKGQSAVTILHFVRLGWFFYMFPVNLFLLFLLQMAACSPSLPLQISQCLWASLTLEQTQPSSTQWSFYGILQRGLQCLSR